MDALSLKRKLWLAKALSDIQSAIFIRLDETLNAVQLNETNHSSGESFIQGNPHKNGDTEWRFQTFSVMSSLWIFERAVCSPLHGCDWTCTHLALVNGYGPGQFEWQLLSTQVDPTAWLEHPALGLQHLCNAAQETHTWESWGNRMSQDWWTKVAESHNLRHSH